MCSDLGHLNGLVVVNRYLKDKLNQRNIYYYWLIYFLLLCLIAAGIFDYFILSWD